MSCPPGQVHKAIYIHTLSPFSQSEGDTILVITATFSGPVHGDLSSDNMMSREYRLYETSPKASGLETYEIGLVSSPYDALDEGSEMLYSTVFDII